MLINMFVENFLKYLKLFVKINYSPSVIYESFTIKIIKGGLIKLRN